MSVKKIGNKTEHNVLVWLQYHGYWAHLFADKVNGQPCDIVAIKDERFILIDVKHCESNIFYLSRIESNQSSSFTYAEQCGISPDNLGFIIYCEPARQYFWLSWRLAKSTLTKVMVTILPPIDKVL